MFRVFTIVLMCLAADFSDAGSIIHGRVFDKRSPGPGLNHSKKPAESTRSHTCDLVQKTTSIAGKTTTSITGKTTTNAPLSSTPSNDTSTVDLRCTCAVFLSGQFERGSRKPPTGYPPISAELDDQFSCDPMGVKHCMNRCLENLTKYIPKTATIICASIDRDCFKERAYLFVKNCRSGWINTNLSAGREHCCKNGEFYKCPTA